jgi:hypothetical protein
MIGFGDFVVARHALWLDKTYGIPAENFAPAEHLNQLRPHHFTNIWRELDRGTLHVINDLQFGSMNNYLAVHRTLLYRFFNSYNGYNRYLEEVAAPASPTVNEINHILDQPGNFSGAYIRTIKRDTAIQALQSLSGHAEVVSELLEQHGNLDDLDEIAASKVKIREALGRIPSFGKFLADQLMLDFAWQGNPWSLVNFKPSLGPGALRGLERLRYTFEQARDEAKLALEQMPRPRLLISLGKDSFVEVPIRFSFVEAEHQLCEVEKLWKFNDAVNEGLGRKVKMRGYNQIIDIRAKNSKPNIHPLPNNWIKPNFPKIV